MQTITINESDLRAAGVRVTNYVREVIECGHEPGVLSGAALKGKAKQFGGSYARTRAKVAQAVARAAGVHDGFALTRNKRWARVWTADGEPVALSLDA